MSSLKRSTILTYVTIYPEDPRITLRFMRATLTLKIPSRPKSRSPDEIRGDAIKKISNLNVCNDLPGKFPRYAQRNAGHITTTSEHAFNTPIPRAKCYNPAAMKCLKEMQFSTKPGQQTTWGSLVGCSRALAIDHLQQLHPGPLVILCKDSQTADQIDRECQFFAKSPHSYRLPDWETLPYDHFSPHDDIISERLSVLSKLKTLKNERVILPITTAAQKLLPHAFITGGQFQFKLGDKIQLDQLRTQCTAAGYRSVDHVYSHGEFAVRGAIFDIFPMGASTPFRLDLFDDEIDSIRTFDPESQRSLEKVAEINLLSAKEFPFDETAITQFRGRWRDTFKGNPTNCPIYTDVSDHICPQGLEYYFPLFFDHTETLFDYLPENTLLVTIDNTQSALETFWQEINERYEQLRHDVIRPILPPELLYLPIQTFNTHLKTHARLQLQQTNCKHQPAKGFYNANLETLPTLEANHQLKNPLINLTAFIADKNPQLLFLSESAGRQENLLKLLTQANCHPVTAENWQTICHENPKTAITIAPIEQGFYDPSSNRALITEAQLLGQKVMQRRRRKSKQSLDPETLIRNLAELKEGTAVVHIDHGIGIYRGLITLDLGNTKAEFLNLEYADEDKLYVPITSLDLISLYSGSEHPKIHRLSGDDWQKLKKKAAKRVRDVAVELLDIYARRAAKKGERYNVPEEAYDQFAESFPFEETPDQLSAIEAVLSDLRSDKPTDRLVCGDVGFGKTEVAMRAAFVVVQNNRQVAILVPTTLLAEQHYQNFCDRFANWPVNIEVISRFKTAKEQAAVIDKLQNGKVDIIIGTHKLLQKDIHFKDLGLLILDEEHRFGVKQKETIKSLRANIDLLTLTATPIPRTLNMAMSNIRDLSIISTPPAKRLSIKTFVKRYEPGIIKDAVRREIMRGGQVFFLHNEVATIHNMSDELQKLMPEARISIAHGQMAERELERVMSDFYHRKSNVLLCTTIIENGIDIPSANTIIINRADKFGLSQLHQLRGRVGRSHHQAYAYLLTPDRTTKDAQRRLEAIQSLEDLGSGFMLATHDLEIRGAGELLGEAQSGQISEIGFSLYTDLLSKAVKALQTGENIDLETPINSSIDVDLGVTALIPDDFIPNAYVRLQCYKRMSNADSEQALDDIQSEMIDRFGLLPNPLKNLFEIYQIKQMASILGIKKINAKNGHGSFEFLETADINPMTLVNLVQNNPSKYQLKGQEKLLFAFEQNSQSIEAVKTLLNKLKR